ncbi:CD4-2 molecule, tandem duplicate 2 isoform X2 [Anguilla anguilla]|nr:CD4-2 molecule, tandem duplicate 2 isoform X2 [Anguilla anguilla]XP_035251439.1 CD4-2 molecule, tandem duplicate 2 isoform X2 [Anguilla anguilla]XP_035251508.1 CD4-2 molecule, tandem duplicate 2 isoform X2 [Anguilla anguilla]XP_035251592.1 CD4-2 molecule, tandem duplicate 2 isoform X2 [Anguilla anguilla]XP_035251685.1 CD4-2 molecule, tandem duplicate 2 isoform X2 [Anguilla anguilla]
MPNKHTCLFSLVVLCLGSVRCVEFYEQQGKTAKLPCGRAERWEYNSVLIIREDSRTGNALKGPAPMKERAKMKGSSLEISGLVTADAGTYTCKSRDAGTIAHQLYVISVSSSPVSPLLQGTQAELRCQVSGGSKVTPSWVRPNGAMVKTSEAGSFTLQSVDVADGGKWACQLKKESKIDLPITVLGLSSTPAVTAGPGEPVVLRCELSQSGLVGSLGLQEGGWERLSPNPARLLSLEKRADGQLFWNGTGARGSGLKFSQEKLDGNLSVTLKKVTVQQSGKYQCFLKFKDRGNVTAQVSLEVKGQSDETNHGGGTIGDQPNSKGVFLGLSLWVWLAIGVGCLVLIVLIIITVLLSQRNKRMKRRARKLRSMRQPLTARDYCRCSRSTVGRPNGRRRGDAPSEKGCQR